MACAKHTACHCQLSLQNTVYAFLGHKEQGICRCCLETAIYPDHSHKHIGMFKRIFCAFVRRPLGLYCMQGAFWGIGPCHRFCLACSLFVVEKWGELSCAPLSFKINMLSWSYSTSALWLLLHIVHNVIGCECTGGVQVSVLPDVAHTAQ